MPLFAISCLLQKQIESGVTVSQTLHSRLADSEDEAIGSAVREALKTKSGFSVIDVLCIEIKVPREREGV